MARFTVEFVTTGDTIEVAETETILSRCLEEGIVNEYSCRVGMCLACSAQILEGKVTQPAARGLTEEQAEEFALTCMARPLSDLRLRLGVYPTSIEGDEPIGPSTPTPADD